MRYHRIRRFRRIIRGFIVEDQLILDEIITGERVCKREGCNKSLVGYHGNREYCDECRLIIEKERRIIKQEKKIQDKIDTYQKARARAEKFLLNNPDVESVIIAIATFSKSCGIRIGIKSIVELIRYFRKFTTDQFLTIQSILKEVTVIESLDGKFVLNNTDTAHTAEIVEEQNPDLKGYFKHRKRKI